jgi:hypothetical protein
MAASMLNNLVLTKYCQDLSRTWKSCSRNDSERELF